MRIITSLIFSAAILLAHAAQAQERTPMIRDARELAPPALLGVWKVDPGATGNGSVQLRSFQLSDSGKLLVNFITIRPNGAQSFGHWALQVDGSPGYEYRSDNGSTPIAEIRFKKVDASTFNLSNIVHGEVEATAVWKLSDDGNVLTATRTPKAGAVTTTVYRKWDGR
jgi:hypothetical protein